MRPDEAQPACKSLYSDDEVEMLRWIAIVMTRPYSRHAKATQLEHSASVWPRAFLRLMAVHHVFLESRAVADAGVKTLALRGDHVALCRHCRLPCQL